jgi:hypothetical protein
MGKAAGELTLGEYLVRERLISQQQLNKALEQQRATSRSLGRILVETDLITESMRMTILQKQFGFELVRLKDSQIDPMLLTIIPYAFAEKHRLVPIKQENQTLIVAMEDPSDILLIDALKSQLGMAIQPVVASQDDIQGVLNLYQTGAEIQRAKDLELNKPPSLWFRILRAGAFPVLALTPLVLFLVFIGTDFNGYAADLQRAHKDKIVSWFDVGLYIMLIWGLWAIILFEINGLIFGTPKRKVDEEE